MYINVHVCVHVFQGVRGRLILHGKHEENKIFSENNDRNGNGNGQEWKTTYKRNNYHSNSFQFGKQATSQHPQPQRQYRGILMIILCL